MQSLLLLPLLVLGVRTEPLYTQLYSGVGQTGNSVYLGAGVYSNDLSEHGMDDDIESVLQTGMWLYYENFFFNIDDPGLVYYVHGIDIAVTFPEEYQNIMTSIRPIGLTMNEEMIFYYEDTDFAGVFNEASADQSYLIVANVSSILITGPSPWTVYTGEDYTGSAWCLYSTDHDVGGNGSTLDFGIFPYVEEIGIPDNSISSLRKGCQAARVAKTPRLHVEGRQKNGAWGRLV